MKNKTKALIYATIVWLIIVTTFLTAIFNVKYVAWIILYIAFATVFYGIYNLFKITLDAKKK